jgi:cytochrome c556
MKNKTLVAAAAALAFVPLLATAQFAKTEDAIKYRQSALFILGQHFGRIGAMANDKMPFDAAQVKESAAIVNVVSKLPWTAFGPNTDKGGNTKARAEVWEDSAKFTAAQERLQSTMPKLVAAADTGDKAKVKEAAGEVGAACKNCHDDFRAR